jgi:hypothetical protein
LHGPGYRRIPNWKKTKNLKNKGDVNCVSDPYDKCSLILDPDPAFFDEITILPRPT